MKQIKKEFYVRITEKGSERAMPAIWYAGHAGQHYYVTVSKNWPSMYEVSRGRYSEMIIDPKDCVKVKH